MSNENIFGVVIAEDKGLLGELRNLFREIKLSRTKARIDRAIKEGNLELALKIMKNPSTLTSLPKTTFYSFYNLIDSGLYEQGAINQKRLKKIRTDYENSIK